MQLPYDDVAQILQFRHLTHGAMHGLDIVEQHEQQDDGADNAHHAKHLLNSHHEDALIIGVQTSIERLGYLMAQTIAIHAISANAMSYNAAKNEALFLSDKMAYELNLTAAQYEAVYEINLDYLMSLNGHGDVFGTWWNRRNADLRYVLNSWQFDKYVALSHFYRPVAWKAGSWTFAVYAHYNRGHFYNGRPTVFVTYKGGHNRIHGSHYAHMHKPAPAPHHPKAPVKVDKCHGITNHTLANNTPRHGHSSAGHFGGRR